MKIVSKIKYLSSVFVIIKSIKEERTSKKQELGSIIGGRDGDEVKNAQNELTMLENTNCASGKDYIWNSWKHEPVI